MTPEQHPPTARAPFTGHSATAHGLSPDEIQLRRDEHGAAHIYLDANRDIDIRIQVDEGRYDTPEQHAADLERDRQALLRLAELATQLAEEIGQLQREGGVSPDPGAGPPLPGEGITGLHWDNLGSGGAR